MELVEGRFRLTFDLGSGALAMTSTKTYNSGVWTKITLQRNRRKGELSVCLSVCPSVCPSVDFSVFLSVSPSICLTLCIRLQATCPS